MLAACEGSPAAEVFASSPEAEDSADGELTLFLAGDAIITQPWSDDDDPAFLALVDAIRAADVALVNLELVLHTFKGYAQADSGGSHMAARPEMAHELAWAGVDMVAHANNHTFDYGSTGVLETLDSVAAAGLVLAGSGRDLQSARKPAYVAHPDGTVGLVAAASSFIPYGKASPSRPDMHGRPGLNPLTADRVWYLAVPRFLSPPIWRMAHRLRVRHRRPSPDGDWGSIQDLHIRIGAGFGFGRGMRVDRKEVEANLAAVREAVASATVTVFSLHAHVQGRWLRELAQKIIDSGADVVFVHGPHRLVGIEIYKRKPILYGLGNFVFQPQWVERFPAEYYADKWLPEEATIEDARKAYAVKSPYLDRREPWESVAALLRFRDGMLRELRLLPLDLSAGQLAPAKDVPRLANSASLGKPRLAHGELARGIIARMSELSRPYGTEIRYLESESVGIVDLAAYLTDAEVTAEMDEESANTTSPQ